MRAKSLGSRVSWRESSVDRKGLSGAMQDQVVAVRFNPGNIANANEECASVLADQKTIREPALAVRLFPAPGGKLRSSLAACRCAGPRVDAMASPRQESSCALSEKLTFRIHSFEIIRCLSVDQRRLGTELRGRRALVCYAR